MRYSRLFTKTQKEAPKDETAKNAQLLIRAGYVYKEMAGVYTFLPLGLRVIENIKQIIREELDAVGAHEMALTALQQKESWEKTDRWKADLDDGIWFRTHLNNGTELGLAFTHEEPLTNIMRSFISSYRDLPVYAYQFQTKFRNELRSKAGLLRGREFIMKDLYDFSRDEEQHKKFYEQMKAVYTKIFERIGIGNETFITMSNGFPFSKYSFEFQTLCDAGEDIIVYDPEKRIAINKDDFTDELLSDFEITREAYNFIEAKSAEVGDIYSLGERYAKAIGLTYTDKEGKDHVVYMGSYGIGVPRVMAVVVENFSDERGIIWPESIAPFRVHLVCLGDDEKVSADELYNQMTDAGIDVLYDDRDDVSVGNKLADADLIGIPYRVIVSKKAKERGGVELTVRKTGESEWISTDEVVTRFSTS